jgi:hypothetical protein
MYKPRLFHAVLVLSMTSASCWTRKSPVVFTPPPPQAQPKVPAEAASLPSPPKIEGDPSNELPPPIATTMPEEPEPAKPAPPARRPTPPPRVVTAPPQPSPEQPAPPKLGQIFTANQIREYNRELNEKLGRVRKNMAILAGKNLNPEQAEIANRIRTFQLQAEQAREQDLVTAVNLARRADLLAQDLVERLP